MNVVERSWRGRIAVESKLNHSCNRRIITTHDRQRWTRWRSGSCDIPASEFRPVVQQLYSRVSCIRPSIICKFVVHTLSSDYCNYCRPAEGKMLSEIERDSNI